MKKYLIAGLIILLPLLFTIMLFIFLIDLFTSPFLNLFISFLSQYTNAIPLLQNEMLLNVTAKILIILLLCIFIFLLGFVARWFFFRSLISFTNSIFSKIPFVKTIYKTLNDVFSSFISNGKRKAFEKTIMVEFPSKDSYCVGFVSGEIPKEINDKMKMKLTPVFVPTAPHPISGYFLLVEENFLKEIDFSNEDAVKFTVSCGLILPGDNVNK
ncbi:MAG: hypothetical protein A3F40_03110 [Chlamydiae bacterium RIFCSPHIGHO2_12_FULL_27_8]|nr:MAG: hypothetical protein A3F40_03110 [Chlamydiae bacterium RIFCSPHIGHO2_12_FULL_27_8]